jgi:hypothetical protein
MGLVLRVCGAFDAYRDDFATDVIECVFRKTGYRIPHSVSWFRRHSSREIAPSGIAKLQVDAARFPSVEGYAHLLICDSWNTVYLPTDCVATVLVVRDRPEWDADSIKQDPVAAEFYRAVRDALDAGTLDSNHDPGAAVACGSIARCSPSWRCTPLAAKDATPVGPMRSRRRSRCFAAKQRSRLESGCRSGS